MYDKIEDIMEDIYELLPSRVDSDNPVLLTSSEVVRLQSLVNALYIFSCRTDRSIWEYDE
jgi:hypothetical protein